MKKNWLDGKTILLTGASSGVGREMTKLLIGQHHCRVIGIGRSEVKMKALAQELEPYASQFEYHLFDVSVRENWEAFTRKLIDKADVIDILINNAGIMPRFASVQNEIDNVHIMVRHVMATNFFSYVDAVSLLLPIIRQSATPAIINISSASALMGLPGTSIYSSSKAAEKVFFECLTVELKGDVYVSCICPGFIKTDLFREQESGLSDKRVKRVCMSSHTAAKKIMRGIIHRRRLIYPGADATIMRIMYNLFGLWALDFYAYIFKKAKVKLFADVFD